MKKIPIYMLMLLAYALNCFAQEEDKVLTTVAILPSYGIGLSDEEFERLSDKISEAALEVLPITDFALITSDVVLKRFNGSENYFKDCKSDTTCVQSRGQKVNADYVAQATVNSLGLKVELYNVKTSGRLDVFTDDAKDYKVLVSVVKKKCPGLFSKIPGAVKASKSSGARPIEGGIGSVQTTGGDFDLSLGKRYAVNVRSEPQGASLIFDGKPQPKCPKTNCQLYRDEGNVQILAVLDQYEDTDTTVFISQNNQNIDIKLKPNFGFLNVKQAYIEGIGKDENWSLYIDGKPYPVGENRLAPGNYNVELSHRCYESLSILPAGIEKGKSLPFDMSDKITLKMGALDLTAEKGDSIMTEPVFVNGKKAGETPFIETIPLCSDIRIGRNMEKVEGLTLRYHEKVEHTHKMAIPKPTTPVKTSRLVAIGLDLLGAAMIGFAVYENGQTKDAFDKYSEKGHEPPYYEDAWQTAESSRNKRNAFYAIGGAILASGIGIHIWF